VSRPRRRFWPFRAGTTANPYANSLKRKQHH